MWGFFFLPDVCTFFFQLWCIDANMAHTASASVTVIIVILFLFSPCPLHCFTPQSLFTSACSVLSWQCLCVGPASFPVTSHVFTSVWCHSCANLFGVLLWHHHCAAVTNCRPPLWVCSRSIDNHNEEAHGHAATIEGQSHVGASTVSSAN